jgi:magnesium transporter
MTIVAARRYRDGKLVESELPADCAPPATSEFDWVGVVEPTAEEMESLRVRYGLHPLAIEDALSQRQAPKAEAYGAQLFVIARTAAMGEGDKIAYGQTALFLGKDFLVTVRHGSERAHLKLRQQLEAVPERLAEGADFVLHAVLDFIVDGYAPLLDQLEETVSEMKASLPASPTRPASAGSSACAASCGASRTSPEGWWKSPLSSPSSSSPASTAARGPISATCSTTLAAR